MESGYFNSEAKKGAQPRIKEGFLRSPIKVTQNPESPESRQQIASNQKSTIIISPQLLASEMKRQQIAHSDKKRPGMTQVYEQSKVSSFAIGLQNCENEMIECNNSSKFMGRI